jgi:hypothetical protein
MSSNDHILGDPTAIRTDLEAILFRWNCPGATGW